MNWKPDFHPLLWLSLSAVPLLFGCGQGSEAVNSTERPAVPGSPADVARDTARTVPSAAAAVAPATLLGSLRTMTERLNQLPASADASRDAAHQLAEYQRGAVALSEIEEQQGRDQRLRQLAGLFQQDQQRQLAASGALAAQLDRGPAAAPGPQAVDSLLRQRLRTARGRLTTTVAATLGAAGRQAQAPNLGMMQTHADDGTGNVDADFATLVLLHQQCVAQVAGAIVAMGHGTPLKHLAAQQLASAHQTIRDIKAWQAQAHSAAKNP